MDEPAEAIGVLVVDDHPVVRRGLRAFLDTVEGIDVIADAADGRAALRAATVHEPTVILLDLQLPDMSGVAVIERLRERGSTVPVLVLTSFASRDQVLPAIRAGADGYLLKEVDPDDLAAAIKAVAAGSSVFAPEAAAAMAAVVSGRDPEHPELDRLTEREREVLTGLGRGWSNRQLAEELFISEKTVKTHVSNILGKLDLTDRTQAALFAVRSGLVD